MNKRKDSSSTTLRDKRVYIKRETWQRRIIHSKTILQVQLLNQLLSQSRTRWSSPDLQLCSLFSQPFSTRWMLKSAFNWWRKHSSCATVMECLMAWRCTRWTMSAMNVKIFLLNKFPPWFASKHFILSLELFLLIKFFYRSMCYQNLAFTNCVETLVSPREQQAHFTWSTELAFGNDGAKWWIYQCWSHANV